MEVPVEKTIQKPKYVENIIEKPVYIEKIVEKEIEVPVEKIIEKPIYIEKIKKESLMFFRKIFLLRMYICISVMESIEINK